MSHLSKFTIIILNIFTTYFLNFFVILPYPLTIKVRGLIFILKAGLENLD